MIALALITVALCIVILVCKCRNRKGSNGKPHKTSNLNDQETSGGDSLALSGYVVSIMASEKNDKYAANTGSNQTDRADTVEHRNNLTNEEEKMELASDNNRNKACDRREIEATSSLYKIIDPTEKESLHICGVKDSVATPRAPVLNLYESYTEVGQSNADVNKDHEPPLSHYESITSIFDHNSIQGSLDPLIASENTPHVEKHFINPLAEIHQGISPATPTPDERVSSSCQSLELHVSSPGYSRRGNNYENLMTSENVVSTSKVGRCCTNYENWTATSNTLNETAGSTEDFSKAPTSLLSKQRTTSCSQHPPKNVYSDIVISPEIEQYSSCLESVPICANNINGTQYPNNQSLKSDKTVCEGEVATWNETMRNGHFPPERPGYETIAHPNEDEVIQLKNQQNGMARYN